MIGVKVKGLDTAESILRKLPQSVQKKALSGMVRAGAKVILEEAKKNVPVDTGSTKESLTIQKQRSKDKNIVHYGVVPLASKVKRKRFTLSDGKKWSIKGEVASGYAAFFLEKGTAYMQPKPFLSTATSKNDEAYEAGKKYLVKRANKIIGDAKR
ncbi:HK97-gp10 family putative phage morphogenesis protein [Arcobacter roscoffensis]|uniref:HK97 gp10 family phage protein n=1 Tax=Arcobacter roscoffensis TaxID=2961520 RepID=A0ABY5E0K3_9BACT|nr:HK97-gp10 family putative phage morphogenesis protein [Arcobacter roscoffensis]UTJ05392.1 HK97 gp10 family phage protein [Arcobacter roscoffensis]